ncbi:Uronate dehydrogenase OS=Castellaniella defragrans OX=75697 GN=HNR28_001543 PE=3 SV=1 [Castellaniella defragrans]
MDWESNLRYPDPSIEVLDRSFLKYRLFNASVERLAGGTRWGEGPVWFGDGRYLLWSDLPNDRIMRWDETTGSVSVFRQPSNIANGNTRDRQGRLVTCEHLGRRVTRTEYDGSITVLMDHWQGKRLNSPNDVVVKSDGSVWFTDPPFGLVSFYEGTVATPELPACVYRIDPDGSARVVADDVLGPNGLCFSPDEKILYVVESRKTPNRAIRAFNVSNNGRRLTRSRILLDAGPGGTPDGMRCDVDGNLWCGWGMGEAALDGIMVFNPQGAPIGRIALPERAANVAFGGRNRNRLFMAAGHSLYSLYVGVQGCAGG